MPPTPRHLLRHIDALRHWARRIKRDAITLWFAKSHPQTPWHVKALAVLTVAYALSPIDLIPDFIPLLGYLDDLILLPGLIWLVIRLMPAHVLTQSRERAEMFLASSATKPRSALGAVLISTAWAVCLVALGWWLYRDFS